MAHQSLFLSNCNPFSKTRTASVSFNFVSYIPVSSLLKFNLFTQISKKNKLLLKQSYLFLTWFFYLRQVQKKNYLSIVSLPSNTTIFTTTKAPMAHRKNSKEQYKLKYYNFHVKFFINSARLNSNETLYLILFYKKNFMFLETNLFFLKNFKVTLTLNSFKLFNLKKLN